MPNDSLVHTKEPTEKMAKLKVYLDEHHEIDVAILFGSYAKEIQHARSDLDLAIKLGPNLEMTSEVKLHYIEQLSSILDIGVDLIDLNRVGQPLLSQIMKYGQLLKGSRTHYANIAITNVNTAQDFLPYISRMMRERRERLLNG